METRHETACFAIAIDLHLIQGPDERAELVALRTKIVFDLHELEANCCRTMNPLTDQTINSPIRQKSREKYLVDQWVSGSYLSLISVSLSRLVKKRMPADDQS